MDTIDKLLCDIARKETLREIVDALRKRAQSGGVVDLSEVIYLFAQPRNDDDGEV